MGPTHLYAHTCLHTYRHANAHRHPCPNGHVNADSHCDLDADTHGHPCPDGDADRDTGTDGDIDRHTDVNEDASVADAYVDTGTDPDAHDDYDADNYVYGDHHGDAGILSAPISNSKEPRVDAISLLKKLSEAEGIAGHEGHVRDLLRQTWQPFVDEMREDKIGSLIALKKGTQPRSQAGPSSSSQTPEPQGEGGDDTPRPKLMLAAHIDEVGLMVTGIEKGFLRITWVGGTDQRVLLGLEVVVHGQRDLPGIVATRPPHVLPEAERKQTVPWDKLFVDVGLPAEEVEQLVAVGDLISIRREMIELKNQRVAGKAMDDRACVAAVTLALEQLAGVFHAWDVFAVATAQEETGLKGAIAAAYGVAPDLAIALDVTFGKHPGVSETDAFPLGKGPTIGIGPNFHPGLVARLRDVAETQEIPYHMEPAPGASGTDAWAIQVTREGVPTALIGVPIRYMHQPVETLAVQDVERAGRLLAAFVAGLEADFLEKLAWNTTAESE